MPPPRRNARGVSPATVRRARRVECLRFTRRAPGQDSLSHPAVTLGRVSETARQKCADRRRRRASVVDTRTPARTSVAHLQRREEREAELDVLLAPGATRPIGAGNRRTPEEPDPFRLCFERDLDRVKHSRPWRRLAGKCQVFIAPEDDHLRTRLTHAVEVAQVATGIARACGSVRAARPRRSRSRTTAGTVPAGHASEEAFSPYLPGGYDHAVYGADVTLAELNLCRGDARRGAQPLVAPARAGDARGRGRRLGRSHRVRLPRLRGRGARRHRSRPTTCPRRSPTVVGRHRSAQVGAFMARGARRGRSHGSGRHDRAGRVGARRRSARSTSTASTCARPRAGRPRRSSACCAAWSTSSSTRRPRVTGGADARARDRRAAAARAVRYVSGMTDRYALALGVELLGWRPEDLPAAGV